MSPHSELATSGLFLLLLILIEHACQKIFRTANSYIQVLITALLAYALCRIWSFPKSSRLFILITWFLLISVTFSLFNLIKFPFDNISLILEIRDLLRQLLFLFKQHLFSYFLNLKFSGVGGTVAWGTQVMGLSLFHTVLGRGGEQK